MTQLSTTYKEAAQKWLDEKYPSKECFDQEEGGSYVLEFAKHLDGFAVIDDKIKILAYERAREVDRDVLFALSEMLPAEKVKETIKTVYRKYNLLKE